MVTKTSITITIDKDILDKVDKLGKVEFRKRASMVEFLVREALETDKYKMKLEGADK